MAKRKSKKKAKGYLLPKYQNASEVTTSQDSLGLHQYYLLQQELEGNTSRNNQKSNLTPSQLLMKEELVDPSWYERAKNVLFDDFQIVSKEDHKFYTDIMTESDHILKAFGDSLIKSDPNFYWNNSAHSPDIAHRNIKPIGTYRGKAVNYVWPEPKEPEFIPPTTEKPLLNTEKPLPTTKEPLPNTEEPLDYIPGEAATGMYKVNDKESTKTSVIKPTITKVVKDSEGNIISTEKGISQEEAGKRFNPKTQSWEKHQNGGPIPKYQNGFPESTDEYGNTGVKTKLVSGTNQDTGKAYTAHAPLYSLPEVTVSDKLDRTNPTAVKNWSKKHDPIAYSVRKATDEAAENINSVAEFLPGYGEVRDLAHLGNSIYTGDNVGTGIGLAALVIPGISPSVLKKFRSRFPRNRTDSELTDRIESEVERNFGHHDDPYRAWSDHQEDMFRLEDEVGGENIIGETWDPSSLDIDNEFEQFAAADFEKVRRAKLEKQGNILNKSGIKQTELESLIEPKHLPRAKSMQNFENTLLHPDGKLIRPPSSKVIEQSVTPMSDRHYVEAFNKDINTLNDIIKSNNKSGINYNVDYLGHNYNLRTNSNIGGQDIGLNLKPGQWKGKVMDIPSLEYQNSIPGIKMLDISDGVFGDGMARRGTGLYKSMNQYLKEFDLGRIASGKSGQSETSLGLWENAVKNKNASGFYETPYSISGIMYQNGGPITKYQNEGEVKPFVTSDRDVYDYRKMLYNDSLMTYQNLPKFYDALRSKDNYNFSTEAEYNAFIDSVFNAHPHRAHATIYNDFPNKVMNYSIQEDYSENTGYEDFRAIKPRQRVIYVSPESSGDLPESDFVAPRQFEPRPTSKNQKATPKEKPNQPQVTPMETRSQMVRDMEGNRYPRTTEQPKREKGGPIRKYQNDGRVEGNVNDWLINKKELEDYHQEYYRMASKCRSGQCLERASMYYDQNVAGLLGTPKYNTIKETAGVSSSDPDAKDYAGPHARYEEYGHSPDTWDIHGLLQEKGAKQIYAYPLYNKEGAVLSTLEYTKAYNDFKKKPLEEREQFFRDMKMPIGSLIGMGRRGGSGAKYGTNSYNIKKGLIPSNHSAVVVGYDETGLPYVYDYKGVMPITEKSYPMMITNITAPKEVEKFTYDYLKNSGELADTYRPLKLKVSDKKTNPEYDVDEFDPFIKALEDNKLEISNSLGIDFNMYDELAKRAVATAIAETKGGDDTVWRPAEQLWGMYVPSYTVDKLGFGKTTGITQINEDLIWARIGTEEQRKGNRMPGKLNALGIEESTYDPWDPEQQAKATIAFLYDNLEVGRKNLKSGVNEETGTRNKLDLPDEEVGYYQWFQSSLMDKGEAWGESEKLKNFRKAYAKVSLGYSDQPTEETPTEPSPPVLDSRQYGGNVEQDPLYASLLNTFQNGGEIKEDYNIKRAEELGYTRDETGHLPSVDHETGMWLKSKEHPTAYKEYISMMLNPDIKSVINPEGYFGENQLQYIPRKEDGGEVLPEELPHQEIVSFPTEREPAGDPRVPKFASAQDYYTNLENTPVPKTISKKYKIWEDTYKSPMGLPIKSYKNIYDIQAFFNSGNWKESFENIENYRKSSHPMIGSVDPKTNTFIPSEENLNTNEEIASHIDINAIPVNFKKVERIPINPDGFAPGSATEFADKVVIPSGNITMKDMQEPILANGEILMPGDEAQFDTDYVVEEKLPKAQDGLTVDNTRTSIPIDPKFLEEAVEEAVAEEKFKELPKEVQEKIILQQQIDDPKFRDKNKGELHKGLTTKEKVSNFMSDLGTEFAYAPRTFWTTDYLGLLTDPRNFSLKDAAPTLEEKQRNRSIRKDDLGEVWGNRFSSIADGATWFMGGELLGAGLGKAGELSVPHLLGAEEAAKKVIGNTYKLNPWAFKPDPAKFYHRSQNYRDNILGDRLVPWVQGNPELAAHLTRTEPGAINLFKTKSRPDELYWGKGTPIDGRYTKQNYPGPYLWEMPSSMKSINKTNGSVRRFDDSVGAYKVNTEKLNVSDAKLYKEDWLRGYKPVDIPKTSGSAMKTSTPKNIDELLALPEEEILNLTGKKKNIWELFKNSDSMSKQRVEKELAKALNREESLVGQFTVPENKVPVEVKTLVEEGKKDAINWIKSDEWLKRRMKATKESREQAEAMRKTMLEDLEKTTVDFKNIQGKKVSEEGFTYLDEENKQRIALGFGDDIFNKTLQGNAEHEFIHAAVTNPRAFQGIKMENIYPEIPSHVNANTRTLLEYLNQNKEKHVRGLKSLHYLKKSGKWDGSSEITDDMVNFLMNRSTHRGADLDVKQLLVTVKDKKTLKDFLNNVYTASGIIAGGAAGSAGIKD